MASPFPLPCTSTAKADHIEADLRRVAVAVAYAQTIRIVAPAAAPYRPLVGFPRERGRGPFPYIPRQIMKSERRRARRVVSDGSGLAEAVFRA